MASSLSSFLTSSAIMIMALLVFSPNKDSLKHFVAYICVSSAVTVGTSITADLDLDLDEVRKRREERPIVARS